MTMKFFSAGIAMSALLAMAACKSETGSTGGAGGSTGGAGGSTGGTGGTVGGGGTGGTTTSCFDCACDSASPCYALCDSMVAGNLNFCTAGMTNGTQCGACVQTTCGSDLANCGM